MSSFAIAASRRGAPVRHWRAAPRVERMIPILINEGKGQAIVAESSLHIIPVLKLKQLSVKSMRFPFQGHENFGKIKDQLISV